ncbi:MAG: hypothetical protein JWQ21_627 [Herminiimonas sp.]|nr:hypothetical protein [Herminiimonas sp.]
MTFWADLSRLSGRTLKTLGHGKVFDVLDINEKHVIVKPHATGSERTIHRQDFQYVFDTISLQGSIDLKGIRHFSEMNPVYIAAMMAALPYITFSNRPKIHLRIVAAS